jgi:hypothetical protein
MTARPLADRRLIAAVLLLAAFMNLLDVLIVKLVLPSIRDGPNAT